MRSEISSGLVAPLTVPGGSSYSFVSSGAAEKFLGLRFDIPVILLPATPTPIRSKTINILFFIGYLLCELESNKGQITVETFCRETFI